MSAATSVYKLTIRKKTLFGSFWRLVVVSLVLLNVQCRCKQGLIHENIFVISKQKKILTTSLPPEIHKKIDDSNIVPPMENATYQQQEKSFDPVLLPKSDEVIGESVDQQQEKSSDPVLLPKSDEVIGESVDQQQEKNDDPVSLPKSDEVIEGPVIRLPPEASKETDGLASQQQEEIADIVSLLKPDEVIEGAVIDLPSKVVQESNASVSHACGGGLWWNRASGLLLGQSVILNAIFGFGKRQ